MGVNDTALYGQPGAARGCELYRDGRNTLRSAIIIGRLPARSMTLDARRGTVLDVFTKDGDPAMLAIFINAIPGGRELRIGERADWNGNETRKTLIRVSDGRAADRAEEILSLPAAVRYPLPGAGRALHLYLCLGPARLRAKGAAGPLLTG